MNTTAKKTAKPKIDAYEVITNKFIESLENGLIPWQMPWTRSKAPRSIHGRVYSGVNLLLLMIQAEGKNWQSNIYATFNQVKKQGGHVSKGEKGSIVTGWFVDVPPKYKKNPESCPQHEKKMFMRNYYVFNLDQTTLENKSIIEGLPDTEEMEIIPKLAAEKTIREMPNPPKMEHGGDRAFYNSTKDLVKMPPLEKFKSEAGYFTTFFHELSHSTGAEKRLNRVFGKKFGDDGYAKEELIAEMSASFLASHCGFLENTFENSSAYIQNWIKRFKDNKKLVIYAAQNAKKATEYILNQ